MRTQLLFAQTRGFARTSSLILCQLLKSGSRRAKYLSREPIVGEAFRKG
jgi:hypothetical protein